MLFFKLQHTITLLIIFIYIFSYFFTHVPENFLSTLFVLITRAYIWPGVAGPLAGYLKIIAPPYNVFSPLKKI